MLRIGISGLILILFILLWATTPYPWWEGFQTATSAPSSVPTPPICRKVTTPMNEEGGGNAIFLDRHNVECQPDETIQQFHLVRSGKGQYQYQYTCCKQTIPPYPELPVPIKEAPHKLQTLEGEVQRIQQQIQRQNQQMKSSPAPAPVDYPLSVSPPVLTPSPPPPVREEVVPENRLSPTGTLAQATGQQSSLLRDIRQLIRNELYSNRAKIGRAHV